MVATATTRPQRMNKIAKGESNMGRSNNDGSVRGLSVPSCNTWGRTPVVQVAPSSDGMRASASLIQRRDLPA